MNGCEIVRMRLCWLGSMMLLVGSVGCGTTESLTRTMKPMEKSSPVKEFAVVAECDVAQAEGKDVPGLVVQVILIDEKGQPTDADGEVSFALYSENLNPSSKMEPDDRFRFADDQLKAAAGVSSLGTVHNFWIPRPPRMSRLEAKSQRRLIKRARRAESLSNIQTR